MSDVGAPSGVSWKAIARGKPFKYEIGANSIEEDAPRITLRDKNGKIIKYRSIEDAK